MWVKLDDGFFFNKKAQAVGKDGRELYIAALTYSARELTDGFLNKIAVTVSAALAEVDPSVADLLVMVGLWEAVEGGYKIHDFHQYNPTADEVKEKREEISRLRAEAGKKGMAARWGDNKITKGVTNGITKAENPITIDITKSYQTDNPVSRTPIKQNLQQTESEDSNIVLIREYVPVSANAETPPPASPSAKASRTRKTPPPRKFPITPEMEQWARQNTPLVTDLEYATEEWLDWARGAGKRSDDWEAAWHTGMRNAQRFIKRDGRQQSGTATKPSRPKRFDATEDYFGLAEGVGPAGANDTRTDRLYLRGPASGRA